MGWWWEQLCIVEWTNRWPQVDISFIHITAWRRPFRSSIFPTSANRCLATKPFYRTIWLVFPIWDVVAGLTMLAVGTIFGPRLGGRACQANYLLLRVCDNAGSKSHTSCCAIFARTENWNDWIFSASIEPQLLLMDGNGSVFVLLFSTSCLAREVGYSVVSAFSSSLLPLNN